MKYYVVNESAGYNDRLAFVVDEERIDRYHGISVDGKDYEILETFDDDYDKAKEFAKSWNDYEGAERCFYVINDERCSHREAFVANESKAADCFRSYSYYYIVDTFNKISDAQKFCDSFNTYEGCSPVKLDCCCRKCTLSAMDYAYWNGKCAYAGDYGEDEDDDDDEDYDEDDYDDEDYDDYDDYDDYYKKK